MPPVDTLDTDYAATRAQRDAAYLSALRRDAVLYEAINGPPATSAVETMPATPPATSAVPSGATAKPTVPGDAPTYTPEQLKLMIRTEAEKQGVSYPLALAVATQESYLNPNAVGDNGKSLGLFQLQPAAAIDAGINPLRRGEVEHNIPGGVRFLKLKLAQAGGHVPNALRRYNGGGDPNYVQNVYKHLYPKDADIALEAVEFANDPTPKNLIPLPARPRPAPKPAQIAAATGPRHPGFEGVDQFPRPPGPVAREAGGVARGVLQTVGNLLTTPASLLEVMAPPGPGSDATDRGIAGELLALPLRPIAGILHEVGLAAEAASRAIDFPSFYKDFRDKLSEGAGSMGTYWAPAIISGGITQIGQQIAKGLAKWALSGPAVAATLMESFSEANEGYRKLRPLVGVEEAGKRAGKILAANVLLIGMTNAAGLGNRVKEPLLKILAGAFGEGGQEGLQYAGQQQQFWVPSEHPSAAALKAQGWKEGNGRVFMPFNVTDAAEVSLIGMILGGGAATLDTGMVREAATPVLRSVLDRMAPEDAASVLPQVSGWGAFRIGGESERGAMPLPGGREPVQPLSLEQRVADYDDLIAMGETMGDPTDQLIAQRDALLQQILDAEAAPMPAAPDDMPQQPSPPILRSRTRPAPTFAEGAAGLTPETFRDDHGRWKIPLRDMPPQELELQDFIRQQGGIKLVSETDVPGELRALVTTKETGLYKLQNNTSGRSLQAMAEAATEAGFPATADKAEFLKLMDRSIRQNQPVYSLEASGNVPLVDDPDQVNAYEALLDMAQTLEARTVVQRRAEDGPRRHADVLTVAQDVVARGEYTEDDIRDLLPGTSLNDDESAKMMVVMHNLSENLVNKMRAVVAAGPEQQDIQAERGMAEALTIIGELDPKRMGVLAESGRSLSILNDPLSSYNQRLRFIHAALNNVAGMTPYRLAQKMLAFEDDRATMLRVAKSLETAAEGDVLLEQWVNGLLAAPPPDRDLLGDPLFTAMLRQLPLELNTTQRDIIAPMLLADVRSGNIAGLTEDEQAAIAASDGLPETIRQALGEERFTGLLEELIVNSTPAQVSTWAGPLLLHLMAGQRDIVGRALLSAMSPGQIAEMGRWRPDILRQLATLQEQGDLFRPGLTRPATLLDMLSVPQLESLGTDILESMLPPGIREVELTNPRFLRLTAALGMVNAVRVLERRALAEMGGKLWDDFTPEQREKVGPWILRVLPDDEAASYGPEVVEALAHFDVQRHRRFPNSRMASLRNLDAQLRATGEDMDALRQRLLRTAGPDRWHRIAGETLRVMSKAQLRQWGTRIIGQMGAQDIEGTPFYIFEAIDPESFPLFLDKLYPQSALNRELPDKQRAAGPIDQRPLRPQDPLFDAQAYPTSPLNRQMPPMPDTLHLDTLGADIAAALSPRQRALLSASTQEALSRGTLTPDELGAIAPDVLRIMGTAQLRALGRRVIMTMNAFQIDAIHPFLIAQMAERQLAFPQKQRTITQQAGRFIGPERRGTDVRSDEDPYPRHTVDEIEARPDEDMPLLAFAPEVDTQTQPMLPGMPGPPRQPFRTHVGSLILEQWIQGLIGPVTTLVNAVGGAMIPVYRVMEEGMAGIISQTVGSGGMHPRSVLAMLRAWGSGFADGWTLAGRAMKTQQVQFEKAYHLQENPGSFAATAMEMDHQPSTRSDVFNMDPESPMGKAFDWWATWIGLANGGRSIFRAMLGTDELAKGVNFRAELANNADIDAYQQGMTAEQAAAHQAWALQHPSAAQLREAAAQQTRINVFQQEITDERPIASLVGAVANFTVDVMGMDLPLGRIIIPFPRVSTNLLAFAIERTPLGLAFQKVRDDLDVFGTRRAEAVNEHERQRLGVRRDQALAKQTLGIMTAVALAKLAFEGIITGRAPEDPDLRRQLEATGWRQYSMRVGNLMYVPLHRFDPFTTQLGLVADFVQVVRDDQAIENDLGRVAAGIVYSLSQNFASRTYLESTARFFSAMAPRYAGSAERFSQGLIEYGRGLMSSFMPWPMTTIQRLKDPYVRETRDVTNEVNNLLGRLYARSPGWGMRGSTDLPYDRNRNGDPRLLGWGFGPKWVQALGNAFSPIAPSLIQDAPIDRELYRQQIQLQSSRPVLNLRAPTDDPDVEAMFQKDPTTAHLLELTPQEQELREIYEAANMAELRKLPGTHRPYDPEALQELTEAIVNRLNKDNDVLGLPDAVLPKGVAGIWPILSWAVQQPQYQLLQSFAGPRGAKQAFVHYVDRLYKDYGQEQFLLDQPRLAARMQAAKDYAQYWRTEAVHQPAMRESQREEQRLRLGQ